MNRGCARFSALGVGSVGEWADVCPFARHRPTQPHQIHQAATPVRRLNDLHPPTEQLNANHCVDGRNHVPSNQARCTGHLQPERLTMSTNTFAPADDSAGGLLIEDTGVIRAFTIMASIGLTFAASAALAIASIA